MGFPKHCARVLPVAGLLLLAGTASAQVHHCQSAAGTVYTDKPCSAAGVPTGLEPRSSGGVIFYPTLPRPSAPARTANGVVSTGSVLRPGCAKTADDLMHEVVMAFDTHDANRLIGVYHWTGLDTRSGYQVASRLQAMTDRTLLDNAFTGGSEGSTSLRETEDGGFIEVQRPGRAPTGISLVMAGRGSTQQRAQFRLRRNAGCWWIEN